MSLDVYLLFPEKVIDCRCECGHEHTRPYEEVAYRDNITHNLNKMAEKAGIYQHLWRPKELNILKARELIGPLKEGLNELRASPSVFREFNPENGWGNYEILVEFVDNYLVACQAYPHTKIVVSR